MTTRAGKKSKKKSDVVQPPVRKTGKKTVPATPGSEKREERDFCTLLRQVQQEKPIEALFNNPIFRNRFRAIIAAFKQRPEDAEELANDVLFTVSRSLPRFEPDYNREYGNFFSWVRRVTRNRFFDTLPDDDAEFSEATSEALRVADRAIDPEAMVLHNELIANLESHINTLPARQRLAATYYLIDGLSMRETAERLTKAGFRSTHVTVRKWVGDTLKGALNICHITPTKGGDEFRGILAQAMPMLPDAIARRDLLRTGLVPFQFQYELPRRVRSNLLQELESEFDSLLASMQTAQSKRAVQTAFGASPAQLGRAAVRHAKRKR